ncbi:MAG TPA: amidohydrolase [Candidatus Akkermansia intestinavium]|nr:amidohydrolase [Candidatus Akkermansia intestinavium]
MLRVPELTGEAARPVCDALYTADYVVTQNDARDVIEGGAVAVSGSSILCVGHADLLEVLYPEARRVDLGRAVLLPGLVNGHTHVAMSLLRGFSDDKGLMDWLTQDIFPQEARLTPELVELGSRFSMAEMIRTGTTAFYDMYMLEDAVFRAADEMGMRAVLGESMTRFYPSLSAPSWEAHAELIRDQARRWMNHPRIRQAVLPHAPYTTSPQLLQDCRALADEVGALFGMHLAETATETELCLKEFGKRPIPYCHDLGILDPLCTFFHVVEAGIEPEQQREDLALLAEGRCAVVHNPASNMKLASGVAPLALMDELGVDVGLGTDGPASNNAQNMFREMYVASLLHKVSGLDSRACPAQRALDMATRGGAAALHDPYIGSLEPGMRADFTALSLAEPSMQPVHRVVSNVVYAASGLETVLTVVDGRELYREGRFLCCDYEGLCEELRSVLEWARRR